MRLMSDAPCADMLMGEYSGMTSVSYMQKADPLDDKWTSVLDMMGLSSLFMNHLLHACMQFCHVSRALLLARSLPLRRLRPYLDGAHSSVSRGRTDGCGDEDERGSITLVVTRE